MSVIDIFRKSKNKNKAIQSIQFKAIQSIQFKAIQSIQFKAIQSIQGNSIQLGDILPVVIVSFKVSNHFSYRYQDNRTKVSRISHIIHKSRVVLELFNIQTMPTIKAFYFGIC